MLGSGGGTLAVDYAQLWYGFRSISASSSESDLLRVLSISISSVSSRGGLVILFLIRSHLRPIREEFALKFSIRDGGGPPTVCSVPACRGRLTLKLNNDTDDDDDDDTASVLDLGGSGGGEGIGIPLAFPLVLYFLQRRGVEEKGKYLTGHRFSRCTDLRRRWGGAEGGGRDGGRAPIPGCTGGSSPLREQLRILRQPRDARPLLQVFP